MQSTRFDAAIVAGSLALAAALGAAGAVAGPVAFAAPLAFGAIAAALLWTARAAVDGRQAVLAVTLLAPTLATATTIAPGTPGRAIAIVAFGGCLLLMPRTAPIDRRTGYAVGVYVGLILITLMRGALNGALGGLRTTFLSALILSLVALFGLRLFTSGTPRDWSQRAVALSFAPAVYVAINIIIHVLGDRIPFITLPEVASGLAAGNPATMLNQLGFGGALRIEYPMAAGVNSFGIVAATGMVTTALAGWTYRGRAALRNALLIAFGVCVAGVLTTDSRVALFVALGVIGVGVMRLRSKAARGLAILLPLTPIALVAVLSALASSRAAAEFSRNGSDFATGTGRTQIWNAILDGTLKDFAPIHLVGYGANGQLTSGAYLDYGFIFKGQANSLYTAHDVYLQVILDMGYIGVAALIWVVLVAVRRLLASPIPVAPALGWAVVAMMLCGVTEAVPSYQFPEALSLFVLLLTACAGGTTRSSPPGPTARRSTGAPGPLPPLRHRATGKP